MFKFHTTGVYNCSYLPGKLACSEETVGAWINKFCTLNQKDFHDLVHGGMTHVIRRTTDHSIEPNYPEEEQLRLMQAQIEIQFAIANELLTLANNQTKIEELNEMAQRYLTETYGI